MSKILENLMILIVEDENEVRKLMQDVMTGEFANVITAQNGDEGLKKFKKYNPDIVVTDIAMPISDGLEMAMHIKEISKDTPVVVLSAYSEKERLLKAIDVGVDKYIMKPIDMDEFLTTLEHVAKSKIETTNIIEVAKGYTFNKTKRVLIKDGVEIPLTKKELAFISLLIKRLGALVLHDEIKNVVWVGESVSEAAIRTFVKRVRDKVGNDFVKNIPGLGYKIDVNL
ncbi:response regulator transcription factor [Campylobacter sp. RM9344]|uniref:Response regulator transcription factor n=1 Tax=Campylobacter californiensis TaxID=1032243 RepID=A0AAW3ZVU2_9BACT|nr:MULTISPECIES: response regulator transcription factor [unclassified Campylobacter]MBE2984524.1 response regulator transcription factor [Campylobacter sp. RM6883]MBE2985864.1 response regulator transcription factor [Campylobacter sp. RM12919]MBE2988951.1 response regulator transcription factor [Campylobacter sp. RM12920]MBE2994946.1 response regulator transcription factor [Campylobacter sp. RM6913]MBE3022966.1 response regulator transcription factor [Campylobacter sp. 7477a]MBE3028965.1 res